MAGARALRCCALVSTVAFAAAAPLPVPVPFETVYNMTASSGGYWEDGEGEIAGWKPGGPGPFPLFVYFPGTGAVPGGAFSSHQSEITREMALRGYVAVAVQYPDPYNISPDLEQKARAVLCQNNEHTAVSVLCADDDVDCSLGVAVSGWSQGAHLALVAATLNAEVNAALALMGARPTMRGTFTLTDDSVVGAFLPKERRRFILAEGDQYYAWPTDGCSGVAPSLRGAVENLKLASGYTSCLPSQADCLQADGSGYYIMTTADTLDAGGFTPDHSNWIAAEGKTSVGIAAWFKPLFNQSLDWLARRGVEPNSKIGRSKSSVAEICSKAWPTERPPNMSTKKGTDGKADDGKADDGKADDGKSGDGKGEMTEEMKSCLAHQDRDGCEADSTGCAFYDGYGCFPATRQRREGTAAKAGSDKAKDQGSNSVPNVPLPEWCQKVDTAKEPNVEEGETTTPAVATTVDADANSASTAPQLAAAGMVATALCAAFQF